MVSSDDGRSTSAFADRAKLIAGTSSWVVCSIGMLVFNKLAIFYVPLPCCLVAAQMAFTVVVMLVCCSSSIHIGSMQDVARWCMVVPFFVGMLLTSIFALKHAPMSLVVTFRGLSPLVSLTIERLFFAKPPDGSLLSMWPLIILVMGAALYARDMSNASDGLGSVGWVLLNTMLAIGDRLLQRRFLAQDENPVDISKTGVSLLNNLLGMVPLCLIAFSVGEFHQLPATIASMDKKGLFWVLASCIVGVGISYTGVLVQSMITATSFLVLVNANKFVIILMEVTCMPSGKLTQTQIVGAMCAIIGSMLWGLRGSDQGCIFRWLGMPSGAKQAGQHQRPEVCYGAAKGPSGGCDRMP